MTDNSIKDQLFVDTHLNDQTVLLQIIPLHKSFICPQFECQNSISPYQALQLLVRMDLEAMAMKEYRILQRPSITGASTSNWTVVVGVLPLSSVFFSSNRLGLKNIEKIIITMKYLDMNQILLLNRQWGVDRLLNKWT